MSVKKYFNANNSFTLIEFLIVIAIIAALAGVITAAFGNPTAKTRDSRKQVDLGSIEAALKFYLKDNGEYPSWTGPTSTVDGLCAEVQVAGADNDMADFLVDNGYLTQIPQNPKYNAADCADPWDGKCHCYIYQTEIVDNAKQFKVYARAEEEGGEKYFTQESVGEEELVAGGISWPSGYDEGEWTSHIINISNEIEDLENYQVLIKGEDIKVKGIEPDPGDNYHQLRFFKEGEELSWFREEVLGNSNDNYWVNIPDIADSGSNINLFESTLDEAECVDDICNKYDNVFDKSQFILANGTNDSSLKAEWLMDEGTDQIVADSAGSNNGTYKGKALEFDGSNDYVRVTDSDSLHFGTDSVVIEHWIKLNSYPPEGDSYGRSTWYKRTGQFYFNSRINKNGTISAEIKDGTHYVGITTSEEIGLNEWHHLIFILDRTTNKMMWYKDGKLASAQKDTSSLVDITNTANLTIGRGINGTINGLIDGVRIYNRALSAGEVLEHYHGKYDDETGLVMLQNFEEGTRSCNATGSRGACLTDESQGGQNDGTPHFNNNTYETGSGWTKTTPAFWQAAENTAPWDSIAQIFANSSALAFNGIDNYVDCGDAADGDYDAMTIEAWIKRTSDTPTGWKTPLHRNNIKYVGSSVFFIGIEAGANYQIVSTIGAGSGAGWRAGTTGVNSQLNTWHHVVNSWDGTTARVYVDGVEKKQYSLSSAAFSNKSATTRIGASEDSAGYLFKGLIDKVRIYDRALTENEIKAHYQHKKCADPDADLADSDCGVVASFDN